MQSRAVFANSYAVRADGTPYARAKFSIELLTPLAVHSGSAYLNRPTLKITTDRDGRFPTNLALPVPDIGGWRWRLIWPDNQHADAIIEAGDGSPVEIQGWIALSGASGVEANVTEWLWLLGFIAAMNAGAEHDVVTLDANRRLAVTNQPRGYWMQRTVVDDGETVHIPARHQMVVHGLFEVAGTLEVDGELVVL